MCGKRVSSVYSLSPDCSQAGLEPARDFAHGGAGFPCSRSCFHCAFVPKCGDRESQIFFDLRDFVMGYADGGHFARSHCHYWRHEYQLALIRHFTRPPEAGPTCMNMLITGLGQVFRLLVKVLPRIPFNLATPISRASCEACRSLTLLTWIVILFWWACMISLRTTPWFGSGIGPLMTLRLITTIFILHTSLPLCRRP